MEDQTNKNYRTPFYETWRPWSNQKGYQHKDYIYHTYIKDSAFSDQPLKYITEFQLITKDLVNIFDFIEPSDSNFKCYSNRIYEVFIRTCIAIESNFKAILKKNGYKGNWNMEGYSCLEKTHKLSEYHVEIFRFHEIPLAEDGNEVEQSIEKTKFTPAKDGNEPEQSMEQTKFTPAKDGNDPEQSMEQTKFTPFKDWNETKDYKSLSWWQAYNDVKHNRVNKFDQANLENLLNAVCALLVVLTSRVHNINNFIEPLDISNDIFMKISGVDITPYTANIEKCFKIIYPSIDKWKEEDKYELNGPFRMLFQ